MYVRSAMDKKNGPKNDAQGSPPAPCFPSTRIHKIHKIGKHLILLYSTAVKYMIRVKFAPI